MLTTLRHFSADAWTDQLAADWAAAYGLAAATTSGAAEQAAQTEPAAWPAEIIQVDHRTFDIAVLTVRTGEPVPYLAGQSVAVEQDPPNRRPSRHRNPTYRQIRGVGNRNPHSPPRPATGRQTPRGRRPPRRTQPGTPAPGSVGQQRHSHRRGRSHHRAPRDGRPARQGT